MGGNVDFNGGYWCWEGGNWLAAALEDYPGCRPSVNASWQMMSDGDNAGCLTGRPCVTSLPPAEPGRSGRPRNHGTLPTLERTVAS